jgi:uncharacterized protein YbjT (DUF2867 family)
MLRRFVPKRTRQITSSTPLLAAGIRVVNSEPGPGRPEMKTPHAATRDIAARLLLDGSWTGQGGHAVPGPEDLSCNDIARIMSEVRGKPIRYQQIPPNEYKVQFMQNGAIEAMAQGIIDMGADLCEHGIYHASPAHPKIQRQQHFGRGAAKS